MTDDKELDMKRKVVTIVDPPIGSSYGFPAVLQDDYRKQLEEAGYPHGMIDIAINSSRYWLEYEDEWEKKDVVEDKVQSLHDGEGIVSDDCTT